MLRVRGLDHVVLTVADVDRALAWYRDVLGLRPEREDEWRRGEVPFVSLRIDERSVIDLFQGERTGTNVDHVSLWVEADLSELAASGRFEVVRPPSRIWGSQGWGPGMYVRDPDGNVIELKAYPVEGDDPGTPR